VRVEAGLRTFICPCVILSWYLIFLVRVAMRSTLSLRRQAPCACVTSLPNVSQLSSEVRQERLNLSDNMNTGYGQPGVK
jgi:hypothetical protein